MEVTRLGPRGTPRALITTRWNVGVYPYSKWSFATEPDGFLAVAVQEARVIKFGLDQWL